MENHTSHTTRLSGEKTQSSPLKWVGICVGIVALAIVAITVFRVPVNTVVYGAILLACPLMHVWMMRGGGHKH